jgi:hypothetical protein
LCTFHQPGWYLSQQKIQLAENPGFFRQVRELKIQRKNPGSALRLVKLQETFDGKNFVFR